MNIVFEPDPIEAVRLSRKHLAGQEGIIVNIAEDVFVETGLLRSLDRDICDEKDIYVGEAIYLGGTIVVMPGDLSLCITTWGSSDLAPNIVSRSEEWLVERGINVSRNENDLLADNKKVVSWARATAVNGWCQSVVHFSIGVVDLELITKICTKPMIKIPGALSDYGITAEMIYEKFIKPII